ncbi:hypothetical protein VTN00DRAFT_3716 [Thermoascus crustaceus]|uniref:uncharacterized protein n=1 Tax=Thermoascus crustaceus TaxID=5088 RepID=UPI003741FE8F
MFVDGVNQGDGVCIRMNNDGGTANTYIQPITSKDIACGIQGEIGASRVCPVKASSTLTFQFREQPNNPNSSPLDPSHKGPAAVYLKKVDSAIASNNAAGDSWFKIWESVYDESTGKWGTTKMIENNGHISVKVPDDIEGGYYLARTELLALHSADQGDPQFYVGCAQLFIDSDGTAKPPTVSIGEGTYDLSMPAMTYNIWETPLALPYPMYGPPVYTPGSGSGSVRATSSSAVPTATESSFVEERANPVTANSVYSARGKFKTWIDKLSWRGKVRENVRQAAGRRSTLVQTVGLKPKGCIFVNGNWCGFEVPDYNDAESCWAASDNCWKQSDACWNKTQPTGYNNCQIWQDKKCKVIQDSCSGPNPHGPPNKGKDLTPEWPPLKGSMDTFSKRTIGYRDWIVRRRGA